MPKFRVNIAPYAVVFGGVLLLFLSYVGTRTLSCEKVAGVPASYMVESFVGSPPSSPTVPSRIADLLVPGASAAEAVQSYERKLIRKGSLEFEVRNLAAVHDSIVKIASSLGGYVAAEQESNSEYNQKYTMTVRVIGSKYDLALSRIDPLIYHLDSKATRVEDVTDQYIDLETRLRNKQSVEESITKLLTRAVKMEDILTIENKLGDIRSEIESLQGRLQVMQRDIALSTIELTFYKVLRERVVDRHSFWGQFADAFVNGWSNFLGFINGLMAIWPFVLIIVGLVFWGLRSLKRRNMKKRQEPAKTNELL
jgi:hypothetical protein